MGRPWPPTRLLQLLIWILLGILASIGPGTSIPTRGGPGLALGAERHLPPAPAFTLPDLDGRSRSLAEFLGSKPILLEFMSLDCPHCRGLAPVLTRLHAAYGIRLQFLTVAFDRGPRRVREFAEREKHAWSYLMGNQETIDAYKLEGVPTFILVIPDGRIAGRMVGSASYEAMSQLIEAVLRGR